MRSLLGGLASLLDVELWFRHLPKNLSRSTDRLSLLLKALKHPPNTVVGTRVLWLLDEHCFLENLIFTFIELRDVEVDNTINEFYSTVFKLLRSWLIRSSQVRRQIRHLPRIKECHSSMTHPLTKGTL